MDKNILIKSHQEMIDFGKKTASFLKKGDIIALTGELGAGKTVFVKGLAQGLNISEEPGSPSFVIINEYKGEAPLYHFDVYRLDNTKQMYDLGYEEYFYSEGITVIEWAEKIESLIEGEYLKITISYTDNEDERKIELEPKGDMIKGRVEKCIF
ncbi:MAG: tRNA (adenosine(37)-N6)-threonylcarbamoyltransferase complex ATPase subunit type 1 TsaE [Armatimonadota bacterium]